MAKFPIYIEFADRRVVAIVEGTVAARKAESILEAGAHLVVAAANIDPALKTICANTTSRSTT